MTHPETLSEILWLQNMFDLSWEDACLLYVRVTKASRLERI